MRKKFIILTLISLVLSAIFFFVWQLPMFIDTIKVLQDLTSQNVDQNTLYFVKVFGSFISSLVITILLAFLFYFSIKTDLSELLASTKEKRLAKAEERRKQQIEELEAQKEELEKKIDDLKKE